MITIAHRLHTIMDCDRVAVMDAGRVAEIGRPFHLLADEGSHLSRLVSYTSPRALQVRGGASCDPPVVTFAAVMSLDGCADCLCSCPTPRPRHSATSRQRPTPFARRGHRASRSGGSRSSEGVGG